MLDFTPRSFRNASHVLLWLGLAFQAGAVNAGGFITCHSFVSHVTGVGTQIGLQLAFREVMTALELLAIPISFGLGAVYSGFLIDRRKLLGKTPLYTYAMGSIFLLYGSVFTFGLFGYFGEFGEPMVLGRDVLLLSILCFACGLQNASITSATKGSIRTTHLTGILSDFGSNLVKVLYLGKVSKERYKQLLVNRIRLGTLLSFSLGSTLGAILFTRYHYQGFLLPTATSSGFFLWSFLAARSRKIGT